MQAAARRPVAARLDGHLVLRTPARPVDAVLYRVVGAVLVLRDAPPAGAVHGGRADRRRNGDEPRPGGAHRGHLRRQRVPGLAPRRVGRRPAAGAAQGHLVRRHPDRAGARLHRPVGLAGRGRPAGVLLPGAVPDRPRYGSAQAQHQRHRGRPVPRGRRPARRGVLHLLHGDQHRRPAGPAHHRLPGRGRGLALRLRRRGRGDGHRPHLVQNVGRPHPGRHRDGALAAPRRSAGRRSGTCSWALACWR